MKCPLWTHNRRVRKRSLTCAAANTSQSPLNEQTRPQRTVSDRSLMQVSTLDAPVA